MLAPRTAAPALQSANALRREISDADDEKIAKIIAYVDRVGDAEVNRTLLDPLRARLALLRPARRLRLARLLFIPLDPLIVSPVGWRPGTMRVPRTALVPLTSAVTAMIGPEIAAINSAIEGRTAGATEVIAQTGAKLWPMAGELLALADVPAEWKQTALPSALFAPLARAVGTVLRRAPHLQQLAQLPENGPPDQHLALVTKIVAGLANESAEGAAMVVQLLLLQAPHAAVHIRHLMATAGSEENMTLAKAMSLGVEQSLHFLESESNFVRKIGSGSVRGSGEQVMFVAKLLLAIENDSSAVLHRARIRTVRNQLDRAAQACFAEGIKQHLIEPLAASDRESSPAEQRRMEGSARDLRALEGAARYITESTSYDGHLLQASDTVRSAYSAGTMTLARSCRLVEILAGPDAALALYHSAPAFAAPAPEGSKTPPPAG